MKIKIEFAVNNAAMTDDDGIARYGESSDVLRNLARHFMELQSERIEVNQGAPLRDYNGNTIGRWEVSP